MELSVKNMVCARCTKAVSEVFARLHFDVTAVELGKVITKRDLTSTELDSLKQHLRQEGFDLIDDQKAKLVQSIKNLVIEKIHHGELDEMKENFSQYLSSKLHRDYNYLSNLFSSMENTTIEQFIILQKIEKVKELLVYDESSVNDIAFRLGYSSQAHLSNQFKKITGFSPLQFKRLKDHHRTPLDKI